MLDAWRRKKRREERGEVRGGDYGDREVGREVERQGERRDVGERRKERGERQGERRDVGRKERGRELCLLLLDRMTTHLLHANTLFEIYAYRLVKKQRTGSAVEEGRRLLLPTQGGLLV